MTAGAVRVAVGDLLFGRVSERVDRHVEVQGLAGKWMIRIDCDRFFGDARDEKRDLPARIIVRDHLHAGRKLCVGGKQVARNFPGLADPWAVPLLGRHRGFDGLSLGHAFELLLETGNDVLGAVKVKKRTAILRLIDDFTVIARAGCRKEKLLCLL